MRLSSFLLIPLLFITAPLFAQDRYVSYLIGHSMTEDGDFTLSEFSSTGKFEFDNAVSGTLSLGKYYGDHIRGEWEVSYREPDYDNIVLTNELFGSVSGNVNGFLRTTTLMYRVIYDFTEHEKYAFQPYISAGLGFAHQKIRVLTESEDDAVLAYQIGGGFLWEYGPLNYIVAEYRYLATNDINFDGLDIDYGAHEFRVGVLMGF